MEVLTMLSALANIVPAIWKFIGQGPASVNVEKEIIEIAKETTGESDPEQALLLLQQDKVRAHQFRLAIISNTQRLEEMFFTDIASARRRDSLYLQNDRRNWRADGMFVLAVAVIAGLVLIIWKETDINEYAKGVFTFILGRFAGYLDNIYSFEFGATRSGTQSDKLAEAMNKGNKNGNNR